MKFNSKEFWFDIATNVLGIFSIWAAKPIDFFEFEGLATAVGNVVFIVIGLALINLKYEKIVPISRLSKEEE